MNDSKKDTLNALSGNLFHISVHKCRLRLPFKIMYHLQASVCQNVQILYSHHYFPQQYNICKLYKILNVPQHYFKPEPSC